MKLRWSIFLAVCCSFFTLLLGRIFDIQLLNGASFRLQADDNRFFTLPLSSERGVLSDRYGKTMVWNTRRYYQIINPERIYYSKVAITRDEALALMATDSGSVVTTLERLYRFPFSLSHVLGFVGSVTAENLKRDETLLLSDQVGKLGLELSQNIGLRGLDGKAEYEIDALGRRQKKISEIDAVSGKNIVTTLDPYISEVAYRALKNQKGAVVVLDAQSGEVLSLVSSPSYDANLITKTAQNPAAESQRQQQVSAMFNDESQVFFNRAINGLYPPGSVFKMVTALAGLENGKIDATTTVNDEGVLRVGEYEYGNWYYRQYGRTEGEVNVTKALSRSNDIFFYKVAEWVGPDALATMAKMVGLGTVTSVELRPQAEGLVPTPAWKENKVGERWYLGNTYHFGIGQGDVLVSPLQVAQMTQAIVNNGSVCQPSLVNGKTRQCTELSFKDENLELVLKGMLDACSNGGTAYPFFPYNATLRQPDVSVSEDLARGAIACKTGTAEFGAADAQDRRRTHGWFAAAVHIDPNQLAAPTNLTLNQPHQGVITEQTDLTALRQLWLQSVAQNPLPQNLVFVSLVESDETQPFKEGSRDASPVIKYIIDWMMGDPVELNQTIVGEGE